MTMTGTGIPGDELMVSTPEEIRLHEQDRTQQIARAAGGALLALYGLRRGGVLGLAAMVAGGAIAASSRSAGEKKQRERWACAEAAITIDAGAQELYERWRHLEALPGLLAHVESVEDLGNGRSRWTVRGPAKRTLSWVAKLTDDRPGERIAWTSLPEADVPSEGEIRFLKAPGDRGTELVVRMVYGPPAGMVGALVAGLSGRDPNQSLKADLRRLKQQIEAGEIATTIGQPAARPDGRGSAGDLASNVYDAATFAIRHSSQPEGATR